MTEQEGPPRSHIYGVTGIVQAPTIAVGWGVLTPRAGSGLMHVVEQRVPVEESTGPRGRAEVAL